MSRKITDANFEESSQLLTNKNQDGNYNNCDIDYGSASDQHHQQQHKGSINFLGSLSIAVNSLTGPAMLNLPSTFQRSGLIPTCATIIVTCILSSLCSLHMADTISKLPNNKNFQKEYEFSDAFSYFMGRWWFLITQVLFFLCVTCLNISSIVDTSQVVDTVIGDWIPGGSVALHFSPTTERSSIVEWVRWDPDVTCTGDELQEGECIAFGQYDGSILLTLGYVITGLIFLPLSLLDLKENSHFQVMGFIVLLICSVIFMFEFAFVDPDGDGHGLNFNNISWWGNSWSSLFGVILFNFALVIAVPAWLYERQESVSVPQVINSSTVLSSALYMAVGMTGGWAIPHVSDNMLESMISGVFGISMQVSASIFAFMIIGLGIPLFSVLTRLNLTNSGLCSHNVGNLLAVFLPWGISWLLYSGSAITNLLSWGGVLFTSLVAFLLPVGLALFTVWNLPDVVGSIFNNNGRSKTNLMILFASVVLSIILALIGLWIG